jgi:hypothetical protein
MSDSLEDIDGIGPTYADRLRDAGFGTVAELAEAEPDDVAEAAEASGSRAEDWVEQARGMRGDAADESDADETGGDKTEEQDASEGTGEASEEDPAEQPSDGEAETDGDEETDEDKGEQKDEEKDEGEEGEDEDLSTKEKLEALGFYDNEFTEFPPELSGLKRFKAEKNPGPIIEALRIQGYDTTFMRLEMVEALGRIGDESAVDVLLEEVNDNDTRMEAMDALGRIGSERATDKILELLDPERKLQPHVRAKAAETAGRIGDPEAVGLLVDTLDSDSSEVRGTAAEALARIGAEAEEAEVVDELGRVLEEETEETVRMSAARALRSLGTDEALDVLSEYENDRNELVAKTASAAQS